jgi:NAD+ synthase
MEMPDYLRINEKEALDYTVEWIRNYFKPLKSKKAVIGLSGGSDSTFTAYACMLGLGKDNVLGVVLPSDSNPKEDENDAYAVARAIGIRAKTINISPIMKTIEKENPEIREKRNRVVRANIKARLRMLLLYKEANESNAIVAGTDDRSEHALGYYTKYGDGGVDINVPEHLYKTQVRQALYWVGKKEGMGVFAKIAEKIPSPRLWKGQTAENELDMRYEEIDKILYLMNEKKMRITEKIVKETGIKREKVVKVMQMMQKNAHKNSLPPSPPIRYFNKGAY